MIRTRKGRAGWHPATPKHFEFIWNCSGLVFRFDAAIVAKAKWGLRTLALSMWTAGHSGSLR